MAEGPQISLRTEWSHRELAGREVLACDAGRQQLVEDVTILVGSLVACVFPLCS